MDHQEPPVGVDEDMALAPDDFLGGVVAACFAPGAFTSAVDHGRRRARFAAGRSRSTIRARSWIVRNRKSRAKRRNQQ